MPKDSVTYQNSGYFNTLINDYLDQKKNLDSLYHRFPTIENFAKQITEKQESFNNAHRKVLVSVLENQYQNLLTSEVTKQNILSLSSLDTFTVTTGHQLNIFTGPLYFLYKIISTINLTKELKVKHPAYNFVPIYWMATEDHDFEEINYFTFKGKKFRWNKETSGPVGRLSTEGLKDVFEVFSKEIGNSTNANKIKKLFDDAYNKKCSLADATRFLVNELFGKYGLVILDGDSRDLKKEFSPYIQDELLYQKSNKAVLTTIQQLKNYSIQVNPREINLFYMKNNLRERIILENETYKINNTNIQFSKTEILSELENHPENFSPNVIMRPLYQEVILPNLCYIGGGGEISYWLELYSFFDEVKVTFPILLLRNSALLATEKQTKKLDKLGLSWKELFLKSDDLINQRVKQISEFPIDLSTQKSQLKTQFDYLKTIAHKTDESFIGAVKAQEAKQKKGLENLEKRLLKAQKRKHADELERIIDLQNQLFPQGGLQERKANFSEFYLDYGDTVIEKLIHNLKPLENKFNCITFS
jgi:bacillithiol biosynthesis cysteine-adding enzyme BshC